MNTFFHLRSGGLTTQWVLALCLVSLLSCSTSRKAPESESAALQSASPSATTAWPGLPGGDASKVASWLQYQSGLQAMENKDWLEAQYYLDLAMGELVSELADSSGAADSEYYATMPLRIVQALESVYPHLTGLGELDSAYAMANDMDFLDEMDDPPLDSTEKQEIKSFLDTLDLSRFSLPVELNDRVMQEIHFLTRSARSFTEGSLSRKTAYEDMIRAKLRSRGMPEDLMYLSMVESGFKVKAYSWAKASGLWQFIPATGKRYGLDVDFWVDMRRNPELATDAAMDYLSALYKEFGDWHLAMAAYNCGEGRIRRLLREGTVDSVKPSYWDLKLPRETMHYVPRILAATIIGHFPEHYGFQVEQQSVIPSDTVSVEGALPLESAAKAVGVAVNTIRDLNPELQRWCTPPGKKNYVLRIPHGSREQFVEAYAKMDRSQFTAWQQYKVRSGDFLGRIARNFGVSVAELRQANSLRNDRLSVGQVLIVPLPVGAMPSQDLPRSSGTAGRAKVYTVRKGDNLGSIARRYGVSVSDIKNWNSLQDSRLRVGQRLRLQAQGQGASSASASSVKTSGQTYTVQSGDSYYSISSAMGVDMAELMALNGAGDSRLQLGQVLQLPAGAQVPKSAPVRATPASDGGLYEVRSGDNLFSIARRVGASTADLQRWNNLGNRTDIRPGQKLQVREHARSAPQQEAVARSASTAAFYVVRSGDSLWDIARRYGVSVQQLNDWNSLADVKLHPGMRLRVSP